MDRQPFPDPADQPRVTFTWEWCDHTDQPGYNKGQPIGHWMLEDEPCTGTRPPRETEAEQ